LQKFAYDTRCSDNNQFITTIECGQNIFFCNRTVERNHACLDRCLNELPQDDRTILLGYYSQNKRAKIEMHRQLAERHKLKPNALRNRAFRLNQRMARCVNNCLEKLPA